MDNPFGFGGEYKDEESGNYYLRARYYDPEIQRFTQEDTYSGTYSNPMSQNGYAFCGNNPINSIDPTGLKTVPVQSNGKAPGGLKVGDVVKTAGGNYTIKGYNKDGSYISEGPPKSASTILKKWVNKYTNQLSNASKTVSEIEKQQRKSNDNFAFQKGLIEQGYSSYNGSYIFGENYIKAYRNKLEADFMLSHADLALSYIETKLVMGHVPTTAEITKYVASSDNVYANLISGFATGMLGGKMFSDGKVSTANKRTGSIDKGVRKQTVTSNKGNVYDITPSENHSTTNSTSIKGASNSSVDILDKNVNIVTRRWFDSNGNQFRDVDFTNHGNPKNHPEWPHQHGPRGGN